MTFWFTKAFIRTFSTSDSGGMQYIVCHYFLPLVGCLFVLLMVSLAAQRLFSLMWSPFNNLDYVAFPFGIKYKIITKANVKELNDYVFF